MDYTHVFENLSKKPTVGIVGATKGYGYTLLAQLSLMPDYLQLRAISSRNVQECIKALEETGFKDKKIVQCATRDELEAADADAIIVTQDNQLLLESNITALVECTGSTEISADLASKALKNSINVYMVSKETDSVCGTYLAQLAEEHQVVYTLVNGDQPRNLIDLFSAGKLLGLDIIAIGKSSEYDFVWNYENYDLTYTDGSNRVITLEEMKNAWRFQGRETLDARRELLSDWLSVISADLCEMNLVSNITGYKPANRFLNYPIVKTSELANVFIPWEDGGILKETGVIDVFFQLREYDEASFAGGEFIIIRCDNKQDWETLAGKGHVVSKNKDYACIYLPYHFMGLETPITILLGDVKGIGNHPETRQVSVMGGVAKSDLPAGTRFEVTGHHHHIDGLTPQLLLVEDNQNIAPFYLLNNAVLLKDVKAGESITLDYVDLQGSLAFDFYKEGLKLS